MIQQIFIEQLLCTRHHTKRWWHRSEQLQPGTCRTWQAAMGTGQLREETEIEYICQAVRLGELATTLFNPLGLNTWCAPNQCLPN